MTKQELIEHWKQHLINENWDIDLAQAEAERVYADVAEPSEEPKKPARKKKEQAE